MTKDEAYRRLAQVLDSLPSGFPPTEDGVEIEILKKIFTPKEAALFCRLRLVPETAEEIAARTGEPADGLEDRLVNMWKRGEIWGCDTGGARTFKMMPWVVGVYEMQIGRMDRELADLCRRYARKLIPPLLLTRPPLMQVVPVERSLEAAHLALTSDQASAVIDASRSVAVNACVCNKQAKLLGKGCDKPAEICLGLSPQEGFFDRHPWGRAVSRREAFEVLALAEERGYVHLSSNVQGGHQFICNCCTCCCPVLRTQKHLPEAEVVARRRAAVIDPALCSACGICAEERCPVKAIEARHGGFRVLPERCLGCGLCVSGCPEGAVSLVARAETPAPPSPQNEDEWMKARAKHRGVDLTPYL